MLPIDRSLSADEKKGQSNQVVMPKLLIAKKYPLIDDCYGDPILASYINGFCEKTQQKVRIYRVPGNFGIEVQSNAEYAQACLDDFLKDESERAVKILAQFILSTNLARKEILANREIQAAFKRLVEANKAKFPEECFASVAGFAWDFARDAEHNFHRLSTIGSEVTYPLLCQLFTENPKFRETAQLLIKNHHAKGHPPLADSLKRFIPQFDLNTFIQETFKTKNQAQLILKRVPPKLFKKIGILPPGEEWSRGAIRADDVGRCHDQIASPLVTADEAKEITLRSIYQYTHLHELLSSDPNTPCSNKKISETDPEYLICKDGDFSERTHQQVNFGFITWQKFSGLTALMNGADGEKAIDISCVLADPVNIRYILDDFIQANPEFAGREKELIFDQYCSFFSTLTYSQFLQEWHDNTLVCTPSVSRYENQVVIKTEIFRVKQSVCEGVIARENGHFLTVSSRLAGAAPIYSGMIQTNVPQVVFNALSQDFLTTNQLVQVSFFDGVHVQFELPKELVLNDMSVEDREKYEMALVKMEVENRSSIPHVLSSAKNIFDAQNQEMFKETAQELREDLSIGAEMLARCYILGENPTKEALVAAGLLTIPEEMSFHKKYQRTAPLKRVITRNGPRFRENYVIEGRDELLSEFRLRENGKPIFSKACENYRLAKEKKVENVVVQRKNVNDEKVSAVLSVSLITEVQPVKEVGHTSGSDVALLNKLEKLVAEFAQVQAANLSKDDQQISDAQQKLAPEKSKQQDELKQIEENGSLAEIEKKLREMCGRDVPRTMLNGWDRDWYENNKWVQAIEDDLISMFTPLILERFNASRNRNDWCMDPRKSFKELADVLIKKCGDSNMALLGKILDESGHPGKFQKLRDRLDEMLNLRWQQLKLHERMTEFHKKYAYVDKLEQEVAKAQAVKQHHLNDCEYFKATLEDAVKSGELRSYQLYRLRKIVLSSTPQKFHVEFSKFMLDAGIKIIAPDQGLLLSRPTGKVYVLVKDNIPALDAADAKNSPVESVALEGDLAAAFAATPTPASASVLTPEKVAEVAKFLVQFCIANTPGFNGADEKASQLQPQPKPVERTGSSCKRPRR